jgi:hypothetical protein
VSATDEIAQAQRAVKETASAGSGDIRIGYVLQAPSGYYDFDGTTLSWKRPALTDTHYLAVTVQDAGNKWHLAGCKVTATLSAGKAPDTSVTLAETWDPAFRHYGSNISAPPGATTGSLVIKAEPPLMRRRDKVLGAFFTNSATATFSNVDLSTSTLNTDAQTSGPDKPVWPAGRRQFAAPTPFVGSRR